jgi:hypothetical protein
MNVSGHRSVVSPMIARLAVLAFQGCCDGVGTTRNASRCSSVPGEDGLADRKHRDQKMQ